MDPDNIIIMVTLTHYVYSMWIHILASTPTVAVLGLEQIYSVPENVGVVELCARVSDPIIECPIEFPFDVRLSTSDNTAGKKCKYMQ